MPIYEYRCDSCGFQKEYLLRMSDAPLTDCPECKKPTFSKMVTAAGFQLKGGGWYVTDFKSGGSNTAGGAKKTEEKQSDTNAKSESSKAESSAAEPAKSEKPKTEAAASSTPASTGTS
jgi:putative FmdB family regulatory protein